MICFLLGLLGLALFLAVAMAIGACLMRLFGDWPTPEDCGVAFGLGVFVCMFVPLLGMLAYSLGCAIRHVL
jgi:hypothetical protein